MTRLLDQSEPRILASLAVTATAAVVLHLIARHLKGVT